MNKYESLYIEKKNNSVQTAIEAVNQIQVLSWEDTYWIAKILYVYGSGSVEDSAVISNLDTSFSKGLNYHTNSELYLDATQMMARLYMKYKRYDEAINFLMSIDELSEKVLDWVHLYYALAQVMSDNITRIAQKPKFFFERLDKVSEKSVSKRNEVFLTYLQRIKECLADGLISEYAKDLVEAKTAEYNLTEKWSQIIASEIHDEDDIENTSNSDNAVIGNEPIVKTEVVKGVNESKIKELESLLISKDSEISDLKNRISELENIVTALREENEKLRTDSNNKDKALTQIRTSVLENKAVDESPEVDVSEFNNNGHALLNRYQTNQKILVIGALPRENEITYIKQRAKKLGFDPERDFDFITDYEKITNIARQINFGKYTAIIAGPMGHSAAGKGDSSSLIEELKGPDYPQLFESKSESGKLKLTDAAFGRVMQKVISYLLVI